MNLFYSDIRELLSILIGLFVFNFIVTFEKCRGLKTF